MFTLLTPSLPVSLNRAKYIVNIHRDVTGKGHWFLLLRISSLVVT